MIWFLKTSYGYIHPRGILDHLRFVRDFPGAYQRFRGSMKADLICDDSPTDHWGDPI